MWPFPCTTISKFCFSLLTGKKQSIPALKVAAFVVGLTLLCVSITTLPLYANQVGWAIPEEYADMFADLVIIGAVLIVSCKYIVEAFTKFKAILEVTPKNEIGAKYPDEK